MRGGSRTWLLTILCTIFILISQHVVADDHDEDDDDNEESEEWLEDTGEFFGEISAWLLGFTLLYFGWKRILPPIRKKLKAAGRRDYLKRLNSLNKRVIPIHTILGLAALLTGIAHGLMMEESNPLLWIALLLMGVLSLSGGLMRWKWPPREVKKGARLLHMQRLLSIAVVVLLLIGHEAL